jgi:membrane associated rhomboid family serine protease
MLVQRLVPWLLRQFAPSECPAVSLFALLFVAITGAWLVSSQSPSISARYQERLSELCRLDPTAISDGHYHALMTYALLWTNELPAALFMLAGLLIFGNRVERRKGTAYSVVVILLATALGGALHLVAKSGRTAEITHWCQSAVTQRMPPDLAEPMSCLVRWVVQRSLDCGTLPVGGPVSAMTALIVVTLLVRPRMLEEASRRGMIVAAIVFLLVDWLGLLQFQGGAVSGAPRAAGLATGVVWALLCGLIGLLPPRRKLHARRQPARR